MPRRTPQPYRPRAYLPPRIRPEEEVRKTYRAMVSKNTMPKRPTG